MRDEFEQELNDLPEGKDVGTIDINRLEVVYDNLTASIQKFYQVESEARAKNKFGGGSTAGLNVVLKNISQAQARIKEMIKEGRQLSENAGELTKLYIRKAIVGCDTIQFN